MKKSIKEKRISTKDKIEALAEYKGVEIDEVDIEFYGVSKNRVICSAFIKIEL